MKHICGNTIERLKGHHDRVNVGGGQWVLERVWEGVLVVVKDHEQLLMESAQHS